MTVAITRLELSASDLREAAAGTQDAKAARRMLAIALSLERVGARRSADLFGARHRDRPDDPFGIPPTAAPENFMVQDLVLRVRVIRYRRERWVTPDGRTVIAPLPRGVMGHFGPELRRCVLAQYHQGQVTVPRLVAQLQAIGVNISKRQVMRLLIAGQDEFLAEARDVLRAGLETAS
jgi:hypothetical protein